MQNASLTRREKEIAILVCEGKSGKEIQDELCLSKGTVKLHRHNINDKLGTSNPIALFRKCIAMGLIEAPGKEN